MKKVRVGINGFGRIGRCIARIIAGDHRFVLAAVNDLDPDPRNLAYLYNYDSTYGRAVQKLNVTDHGFELDGDQFPLFGQRQIDKVGWQAEAVDVVIDASGVAENVRLSHHLIETGGVKKVVVTHSPKEHIDHTFIVGVNDKDYDASRHHVVSSSICDANAIAHVLTHLDRELGIERCFATTLHPWLSYQNLVDAPLRSQSKPGHFWTDYSLGRASVGALIPKDTTAAAATIAVCPEFAGRLDAFSYRTPTHIVTSADLTFVSRRAASTSDLKAILRKLTDSSKYVRLNEESLVSVDYEQTDCSAVIDAQWARMAGDTFGKVVLWYDNEWGYSHRVLDLVEIMMDHEPAR
jgi:glyceraldehyde 3-phosphate dehydrogenase